MVRTDQYKYCVYSRGERRESLVAELLADNVKPIPFANRKVSGTISL